jgi:phosphoglycerate dehydrogenase-like enzyme
VPTDCDGRPQVCLPGGPETRGLLGEKELGLLPSDAVLVNVGRGEVVDEEALYEALKHKKVRGFTIYTGPRAME